MKYTLNDLTDLSNTAITKVMMNNPRAYMAVKGAVARDIGVITITYPPIILL